MKLSTLLLSAALLVAGTGVASAKKIKPQDRDHRAPVVQRDHRKAPVKHVREAWKPLAKVSLTGKRAMVKPDRSTGKIDQLKLDVSRGNVMLNSIVVTYADGKRAVMKVNQRLAAGKSHLIKLPGAERKVASIMLRYNALKTTARVELSAR